MSWLFKKSYNSNDAWFLISTELSTTSLQANSAGGSEDVWPLWTLSLSLKPLITLESMEGLLFSCFYYIFCLYWKAGSIETDNINLCTIVHDKPSNSSQDILLKTTFLNIFNTGYSCLILNGALCCYQCLCSLYFGVFG